MLTLFTTKQAVQWAKHKFDTLEKLGDPHPAARKSISPASFECIVFDDTEPHIMLEGPDRLFLEREDPPRFTMKDVNFVVQKAIEMFQ